MEAEWIADRDHELADTKILAVRELGGLECRLGDADHREIGRRVATHDLRAGLFPGTERDLHRLRAVDDMRVRQRVAVRRDDDAAAAALATPHVDHARRDALDDANDGLRVGVEERARRVGISARRLADIGGHLVERPLRPHVADLGESFLELPDPG